MIVANPVDKVLYYYSEGMAAPMGNFQNYRREPRRHGCRSQPTRDQTRAFIQLRSSCRPAGRYDVAFLNDSPRVSHCFRWRKQIRY